MVALGAKNGGVKFKKQPPKNSLLQSGKRDPDSAKNQNQSGGLLASDNAQKPPR